jgi:hypothetical protein
MCIVLAIFAYTFIFSKTEKNHRDKYGREFQGNISLNFILMLSCHLRLCLPSRSFLQVFRLM